ncbi:MAG: acyl-CoA dehydrogenase family protein [Betaproteobacteria bacterium]|nr:acyl-CoA dehydrogenase family protein [Betaproteobacteria bacterium]
MDFSLTEEQRLLQESLARFAQKEYSFEKRRAIQALPEGFSREAWGTLVDMGVVGLPFAEEYGGIGGGPVETMIVMTAAGSALMLEPYLATVVLGGGLVQRLGDEAQKQMLSSVAEGKLLLALAHDEPGSRWSLADVNTRAVRNGGRWRLSGRKAVVLHGAQAGRLLVSARTAGKPGEEKGISLFLVERLAKGLSVRDYRTADGLRAADVALDNVEVEASALLGGEGTAHAALDWALDMGAAALCAEAVGAMEGLNAQTLEYVKQRQQFGQPIGRFQVNQHKAADMFIHTELSKSMAYLAAMRAGSEDARERAQAVSAAKVHIGKSGRFVAETAIQMHGGMGMSNELAASHYAKRLVMIDFWLGDTEHHLDRFIGSP